MPANGETRAKVHTKAKTFFLCYHKQICACGLEKNACGETFCLCQMNMRREFDGGGSPQDHEKITTQQTPVHHQTDTNKRPCPHTFSSTNMHINAHKCKQKNMNLANSPTQPHTWQPTKHAKEHKENKSTVA